MWAKNTTVTCVRRKVETLCGSIFPSVLKLYFNVDRCSCNPILMMEAGMFEYNKEEQSVDLDFFQGTFGILTITTIICQSHSNTDCLSTPSFSPVIGLLLMLVYIAFWLTRGRCVTSLWQIWQMGDAAQLLSEV